MKLRKALLICGVLSSLVYVGYDLLAAVFLDQLEAVRVDGRQVAVAGDEGDLFARQRQPGPQVAADGTGADDREFQGISPTAWVSRERNHLRPLCAAGHSRITSANAVIPPTSGFDQKIESLP